MSALNEPDEIRDMRRDVKHFHESHHDEEPGDRWTVGNIRAVVQYVDELQSALRQQKATALGATAIDDAMVELVTEIIAVTMFDYQVFGMQSMKRCVVEAWEEQPKDAQASIRREARLIAEKITAALRPTREQNDG